MISHEQKVENLSKILRERKSNSPLSFKKKAVSHQVPKPNDKTYDDEKIDLSNLDEIIEINKDELTCTAESGVTFVDLVNETIKHNLVPYTVPELKTITIGGAVAGASLE